MNNILNCLIEIDNIEREIIVYLFEALWIGFIQLTD
jgi:hypothetical protein